MVGISLLTLVPGELGGSETYVRELARALARRRELEYRAFVPPVVDEAGGLPLERVPEYRAARSIPQRLLAMGLAAARPGPIRRRLERADAVHYPLTIALPEVRRPYAATLLDLQHLDLPQLFSRAERAFRAIAWHRSLRHATIVITISEFVRDRAVELLGLDSERIRAIHLGLDHERLRPDETPREPFLLYPARRWPHKNHDRLLAAFELLRRERPELRLVLTGAGHDAAPARPGVEVLGHVPEETLLGLYRRAACLVFPSLYEGFGQPTLEAMACGCPVVAADAGALPEVCGEAAHLFDPTSVEAICAAVGDVLSEPEVWRARGLARAREFTWAATAAQHEQVYRELLA